MIKKLKNLFSIFFFFFFFFSSLLFSSLFLSRLFFSLLQSMAGDKATQSGQHSISKKKKPSKSDIIFLIQKIHSNHKSKSVSQIHISIENKYQILQKKKPENQPKQIQKQIKTKHKSNLHLNRKQISNSPKNKPENQQKQIKKKNQN